MTEHQFPAPWTVRDLGSAFAVEDASGLRLVYVYFDDDPDRRNTGKLLSRDEAAKIAVGVANLPELLLDLPPDQ